ncbi:class II aldolase/adducin family protein [Micromonospora sp. WMMD1082]|uniref:class II aldolase/adducin family protein n=1 Tax=Micromonospora sp. WMMD1082 TaxID=3016104 RepID=UPI0024178808|nr:class II aldolase/adducin family protein [Micromonospora sp. WMMD1082]MDG4794545.1 class II aldolase/adducin family protein [Micromonospora sp. WMMD1082]
MSEPPPLSVAERRLTVALAYASRMLSDTGHDDFNQGQVSARMPGSQRFLIKGALCGFNEAEPKDMVLAQVDPDAPAHRMAPPELPLHQAIYAARPDVNAIVHSHAPHTLVFGALEAELAPLSHEGALYFEQVPRFTVTSNTILTYEVGSLVAKALGPHPAAFLRNHGGVAVGRSIRHAAVGAQVLERCCQLHLMALSTGLPFSVSTSEDVDAKRTYIYSDLAVRSYWDHAVRRVRATCPESAGWDA